jgi:hypothetical protein
VAAKELAGSANVEGELSELVLGLGWGAMEGELLPRGVLIVIGLGHPTLEDGLVHVPLTVQVAT